MDSSEPSQSVHLGLIEHQPFAGSIDVKFLWGAEPKKFGGFDQERLRELSNQCADFFHIPPGDRENIHLYFGDHVSVTYPDGRIITPTNIAIPGYKMDGKGTVNDVTIIINRSRELFREKDGGKKGIEISPVSRVDDIDISKYGFIGLSLRHPWELVAWCVAEEINHAAVTHRLGTLEKINEARTKFYQRARTYHRAMAYIQPYSIDLMEVTASRQVLRFLKKLAQELSPERIPVYEKALQASFDNRLVVLPGDELIKEVMYVNTGYKPIVKNS